MTASSSAIAVAGRWRRPLPRSSRRSPSRSAGHAQRQQRDAAPRAASSAKTISTDGAAERRQPQPQPEPGQREKQADRGRERRQRRPQPFPENASSARAAAPPPAATAPPDRRRRRARSGGIGGNVRVTTCSVNPGAALAAPCKIARTTDVNMRAGSRHFVRRRQAHKQIAPGTADLTARPAGGRARSALRP